MKKIAFCLSAMVMIVLVALYSFGNVRAGNGTAQRSSPAPASSIDCDNDGFFGLTAMDFMKGIARYRDKRWRQVNKIARQDVPGRRFNDPRSCWYSLDTLKKFICLIEKYSQQLGLPSDKLGINFYYAVYPGQGVWNEDYRCAHTLFMAPTFSQPVLNHPDSSVNIDFDPRFTVDERSRNPGLPIQTYAEILRTGNASRQVLVLDGSNANGALRRGSLETPPTMFRNQGQLCPNFPNCPVGVTSVFDLVDGNFRSQVGY